MSTVISLGKYNYLISASSVASIIKKNWNGGYIRMKECVLVSHMIGIAVEGQISTLPKAGLVSTAGIALWHI